MIHLVEQELPALYRNWDVNDLVGADNTNIILTQVNTYVNQLNEVEKNGHNLYIYSVENGTGKTSLGYYILKQVQQPRIKGNGQVELTKIAACKFANYLKFCTDKFNEDAKQAKKLVETTPFLLLDDVSPWALTSNPHSDKLELILLMMYRREHLLPTIYTSNLTPDKFNEVFGATTSSKVLENFSYIEVVGGDVRNIIYEDLFKKEN